jgi:hypothetical protein
MEDAVCDNTKAVLSESLESKSFCERSAECSYLIIDGGERMNDDLLWLIFSRAAIAL